MTVSRRDLLGLIALAPLGIAAARAEGAPACYDPAALAASQKGIRKALGFKDLSPDPARHCGACAFFAAAKPAACGTCALLSGGPVSAASVCNSFARKG
jgi:hypothetical protein